MNTAPTPGVRSGDPALGGPAPTSAGLRILEADADPVLLIESVNKALSGGAPVAPLPRDSPTRRSALAMLRPDVPIEDADIAVVVTTSGSTSTPKGVLLSRKAIRASVTATHDRLGGPGSWALALPAQHVAGLMVLVRAAVSGTAAVPVRRDLADLSEAAAAMPGRRYLSLVSTQLVRALTDRAVTDTLVGFDAVLLGGGPTPAEVLDQARTAGITVVTTYGMSETCGGCVYDGRPLDGTTVEIGEQDRISIRSPSLFSGYRLDPDLTALTLRDGALRTQDRGVWSRQLPSAGPSAPAGLTVPGLLTVLGRLDDVVTVGGQNVDLAHVSRVVGRWAAGRGGDGLAVGLPDTEWGTTVVAVCDTAGDLADLHAQLSPELPRSAWPRRLVRLESLPQLAAGKPDRVRIRQLLASQPITEETTR